MGGILPGSEAAMIAALTAANNTGFVQAAATQFEAAQNQAGIVTTALGQGSGTAVTSSTKANQLAALEPTQTLIQVALGKLFIS